MVVLKLRSSRRQSLVKRTRRTVPKRRVLDDEAEKAVFAECGEENAKDLEREARSTW